MSITTHVLDTSKGRPAPGVQIVLERLTDGGWSRIGEGRTDADGRLKTLLPDQEPITTGRYRLTFDTGTYFAAQNVTAFYPDVTVTFEVSETGHYHVPLLLSPFGYSTYRGS